MEEKRFVGFYNPSVILTYCGVLSAFVSIYYSSIREFKWAIMFIMISGVCDMFDGTIARMVKRTEPEKKFGIQLDSICDICCFGITPAILGLQMYEGLEETWIAFVAGFVLTLCGIIRLAYFNVMEEERQAKTNERRSVYQGLPITATAIMAPVAFIAGAFVQSEEMKGLIYCVFEFLTAFLFVFNLPWPKPHGKSIVVLVLVGIALFAGVILV